jgi:acetamidase/formamidase
LTVLTGQDLGATVGSFPTPFAETDTHWIPTGLHTSLDDAMRRCVRNSLTFLTEQFDFDSATAPAYLSAAGNFEISQIVDAVKGLHCMIRKADFADRA